jgi:hypothetical protein
VPIHAIQSAEVATISAAWFDSTHCSLQVTSPLPATSISSEVTVMAAQSRRATGRRAPRSQAQASMRTAAARKRTPANSHGGRSCTPTRMAR